MSNSRKPKIFSIMLALVVVFLMSAGTFIGAAENGVLENESKGIDVVIPSNPVSEPTSEGELEMPAQNSEIPEMNDLAEFDPGHPAQLIPGKEPELGIDEPGMWFTNENGELIWQPTEVEDNSEGLFDLDLTIPATETNTEVPTSTQTNSLSEAMSQLVTPSETTGNQYDDDTQNDASTRTRAGSLSITLGADNDQQSGHGMGRIYGTATSSTMYSYDYPYWYMYENTGSTDYKTWAVYDLSDLAKYKNAKITSGTIHYWHYNRYYLTAMEVWTMNSVPYEISGASTTAKGWFNEIGGTGSVKLGSTTFPAGTDTSRKDKWMTLSSGGITELNKRLNTNNLDFAMGGIATKYSSSYGRLYMGDVRLELNFTYTAMPDEEIGEVAVGDEVAGYGSSSSKYDYYNYAYLYSSSSYVAYASWDTTEISKLIPTKGPGGEVVEVTGVSLRFNSDYISGSPTVTVNDMTNNPKTTTTWSTIYNDARAGKYDSFTLSGTVPVEKEWDLGSDALDDLNDTLDGSPSFFALGFTSTGYGRIVSPKLVVKWRIVYPPTVTFQLGADNPTYGGQGLGYTRPSGSNYYIYSYYYSYMYKSSTNDYHGWMAFDVSDLNQLSGVSVKSVKLVIHNYYRNYIEEVNFTSLKTVPYYVSGAGNSASVQGKVYTESGPTGNVIGGVKFTTSSDSTKHTIEAPLDAAAATALNSVLSSTSSTKFFGVGMYVNKIFTGYTYGNLRWTDIRLSVEVEYDQELQPTKKGQGIAFGDDWSGHLYKYTTTSDRPYGYMYTRASSSSNYRSYAQWDINKIASVFPVENFSLVKIQKVSLRFNHYSGARTDVNIYQMKNDVTKITSTNADTYYTDCGVGPKYYGPGSVVSSRGEYEWVLSKDAVKDFQAAFEDSNPDYFGVGIAASSTSTTSSIYDFSPRLVIEWGLPPPSVLAALVDETPEGLEGTPAFFNANASRNLSGGIGGLRYEWDWDNDGKFDENSMSPYTNRTWVDNMIVPITLRVNDTITGKNNSIEYNVTIHNVNPQVNKSSGMISPSDAYEAENVTFSGFTVEDPGNDTWVYFWDFNGNGTYDVGGKCNGTKIPPVTWYFDDDFLGEASLLVVDDDGGSTNLSTPYTVNAVPPSGGSGYAYSSGSKATSSAMYVEWQYTTPYRRGWAKVDLSEVPEEAIITKVLFKGYVAYNRTVNWVGVRLLTSDPMSATGSTVFSEAGSGTRLFGLGWTTGLKVKDLTKFINTPAGQIFMKTALDQGWVGFGLDLESPKTWGQYYGYMYGYSGTVLTLEIHYNLIEPGCLIPVIVKNQPPIVNCSTLIVSPTEAKEGDLLEVSNITFCDPGNDTYEGKIVIGDYDSGWVPLGERPIGGGGGGPAKYPFLKTYPTGFSTNSPTAATRGNRFTCESDNIYVTELGVIIPSAYSSSSKRYVTLWDRQTQKSLAQVEIKNLKGDTWTFEKLTTPVKLTKGNTYTVAEWGTGYFYTSTSASPWTGDSNIKVSGTDYANSGTKDTYPTSYLAGYIYGIADIGYTVGSGGGPSKMMDIGTHVRTYNGNTRGFHFVAPTDFVITGVRETTDASTGAQDIEVVRFTKGAPPAFSSTTNDFVSLGLWNNKVGTSVIPANIQVKKGDIIGIYGKRGSNSNSYGAANYATKIGGFDTTLVRSGMQYILGSGGMHDIWSEAASPISRCEMYYTLGGGGTPGWGAYGPGCWNLNNSVVLNMTIPDDHPLSGTSMDNMNVTIMIRDDDDHKLIPGTGIGPTGEEGPKTIHSASSTSTYYNGRKLVMRGSTLYAVLQNYQSPNYNILLAKSTDGGENWEYTRVNDQPYFLYAYYPTLAIDSQGVLHVAWRGYASSGSATGYQIRYACSRDDGKTWGEVYNLTTGYGYHVSMAVDLNDNVHIALTGYQTSSPYKVFYINRSAGGVWGNRIMVSESNVYCYDPNIDVDTKGNAHIVWRGYRSSSVTSYAIRHRMSTAATGKWSPAINLTTYTSSTDYHLYPSVACDKNDNAHVAWTGRDNVVTGSYNIRYMKFDASTQKWGPMEYITKITTGNPYQYYPSIAVNNESTIDVVWAGYRSPSWSYPYIIHHARKVGTTWDIDWNFYESGTNYQYYPVLMQNWNCLPNKGYAFVWLDGGSQYKYFASEDFEFGKPEFTDGLGICEEEITVHNVAPKIDLNATYTVPSMVREQEDFILKSEFVDPAAGINTETFEYNITWGDGQYTGWNEVTKFKEGKPAGLTELEIQPNAEDGKDTHIRRQYPTYNYATYPYAYIGSVYQTSRGLVEFDTRSIPPGYNVTNATMELSFGYRYGSGNEKMNWYTITEGWSEGTGYAEAATGPGVTWNNQPEFNDSKPIGSADWATGGGMMEIPLDLEMVQNWINDPNSNYGMISKFEHEANSTGNYGYFYASDYSGQNQGPKLILEFDRPLPAILPRGVIEAIHMYPDDHPETGTPWDMFDITIDIRDDDLGTDYAETELAVNDVPPDITVGNIYLKSSTPWTTGKFGYGLMFDGVDDYVDCGNDESLDITNSITIEAWIMPAVVGETGAFTQGSPISKAEAGTTWSWQIRYNAPGGGNYLGFQCNDITAGSTWVTVKQALPPGKWYHIAAKFDSSTSTMSMYLNGVQTDSASLSGIKSGTSKLFIGYDGWPNNIFNGKIDDVAIFDRALSTTEIKSHMTNGIGGGSSLPTGLAGYWDFNEGTGRITHDSSSNNNHGKIYGRDNVLVDDLEMLTKEGIPEGTQLTLEGFEYDDVAYDVWSERDYGFNFSFDWGDGTPPSEWSDDFQYTGGTGGSSGSASEENIAPLATPTSGLGGGSGIYGPASMNDLITTNMCWVSSSSYPNSNYFQLTWSKKYTIARMYVIIHGQWSSATNRHLDGFDVQYRVGTTWVTDSVVRNNPGDFEYIFKAPRTTDAIRLFNLVMGTSGQTSNPCVYEWYVYPGGGGGIINERTTCSASALNNGRKIVMDSNDNLYTVFVDQPSPYQISISNSSDLGETWNSNPVSSGTTIQREPSISIDSSDRLHVVWRGMVSGVYQIRYANSANGGISWGGSTTVTSDTNSQFAPAIAVDSNDMLHIVWFDSEGINYINRTSTGTWGTQTTVATGVFINPNVAMDSSDNAHVVWSGAATTSTVNNIHYRMLDAITGWGSVEMLTTSTTDNNDNPSLVIDADDNMHVAWQGEPTPIQIMHIGFDVSTSSWGSIETITSNAVDNTYPTIGVDHRGFVYVAWAKDDPYQINMTMFNGQFWLDEFELTSPSVFNSTVSYPSIIYGGPHSMAGRGVCLVFTADNLTACNLYFGVTTDWNHTDFGPWKGIPSFRHIYRDDNPSMTNEDVYNLKIRVRDDDTLIGEWVLPLKVNNVWPELDLGGISPTLVGEENALYTPEITFMDPGTGPTETWSYWFDTDGSQTLTPDDFTGDVTSTTVVDDVTYGTIPPILTPFNDEYIGDDIGLYLYDDDIIAAERFVNITYKITGSAEVETVKAGTYSTSTGMYNGRNLVMDSKGNFYAVYTDYPAPYKVVCSVSTDLGKTWTQYKVSTESTFASYYQYYASVAIDSNDVLHVVWRAQRSGYSGYHIAYKNSKDGGKTWGNLKMLPGATSGTNYFYAGAIAVDSKDTVHVVVYGYSSNTLNTGYNIHYYNRTSGGTWSTFKMVTTYSYRSQYYPSIAVDTKDNVHVAWYGYTQWVTYYNIQYRKMNGKTGAWGPLVMITNSSTEYNYYPNVGTDLKDNVYVTWSGYPTPYQIKCRRYNATSKAWEATETVFSDGNYNYYPSVGADQRGYIYIAFSGGSPYQIKLTKKTSPSSSWETPVLVTDGPNFQYQYYPSIMGHGPNCHPLNGAAIVWSGYMGSSYDTMFYASDDFWLGEIFERTGYKVKFDVETYNMPPTVVMPPKVEFLPDESIKLPIHLSDQGSDDLYFNLDWGDGTSTGLMKWYNNDVSPEPGYSTATGKIHSALNGTAPFSVDPELYHNYRLPGKFMINMTIWDDDEWNWGMKGNNFSLPCEVLSAYRIKEVVIRELEQLLPGRMEHIGYKTITVKYHGKVDPTLLVYNHIERPPYFWETKLLVTFCNVKPNDTLFINGSWTDAGFFGDKLILKLYNDSRGVIDVSEIPTVYTCLEPLKVSQRYGLYEILGFTYQDGMTYHHYSQYALKTEDALDHVLRSINRDPRRGYGWWHEYWAWWCGFTYYRGLWIDDMHLDPQFGLVVFCEERAAVLDLMEVLKNCLDPQGVKDITFKYNGKAKVDVEMYLLSSWWWAGWTWYDAAYDLMPGETFIFDGSNLTGGMLPDRIMFRVYHAVSGALLDTIYVRTSGEWYLEVEPGNLYGNFEIEASTLIIGNSTEWDEWWGGDTDWWDWFFGFWYWENEMFRSCEWEPDECFNKDEAAEEQARICSNASLLKQLINMLVKADELLALQAYLDAGNVTVQNESFRDEYMYHYKWSLRYHYRGYDNYKKGRPHRAIDDFRSSWKHAILAVKWANENPDFEETMHDPCNDCKDECGNSECEQQVQEPWWMYWYHSCCNKCQFGQYVYEHGCTTGCTTGCTSGC